MAQAQDDAATKTLANEWIKSHSRAVKIKAYLNKREKDFFDTSTDPATAKLEMMLLTHYVATSTWARGRDIQIAEVTAKKCFTVSPSAIHKLQVWMQKFIAGILLEDHFDDLKTRQSCLLKDEKQTIVTSVVAHLFMEPSERDKISPFVPSVDVNTIGKEKIEAMAEKQITPARTNLLDYIRYTIAKSFETIMDRHFRVYENDLRNPGKNLTENDKKRFVLAVQKDLVDSWNNVFVAKYGRRVNKPHIDAIIAVTLCAVRFVILSKNTKYRKNRMDLWKMPSAFWEEKNVSP